MRRCIPFVAFIVTIHSSARNTSTVICDVTRDPSPSNATFVPKSSPESKWIRPLHSKFIQAYVVLLNEMVADSILMN